MRWRNLTARSSPCRVSRKRNGIRSIRPIDEPLVDDGPEGDPLRDGHDLTAELRSTSPRQVPDAGRISTGGRRDRARWPVSVLRRSSVGDNVGVNESPLAWTNATHDWASTVDTEHLAQVRREPHVFAAGGTTHLILEVLAYAADEAEWTGSKGRCLVTLYADGSVSVADDGRGTDTRDDAEGRPIKKPIMATKDLRFFDAPDAQLLPDGRPRRGMSAVAALSPWLIHTNRRRNGAWRQRYEHGVPVTGLLSIPDQHTTGTTVHFLPAQGVRAMQVVSPPVLGLSTVTWPQLAVEVIDERSN